MITINLLHPAKIKRSDNKEFLAIAQVLLLLVIIFCAVTYIRSNIVLNQTTAELKQLRAELDGYRIITNELEAIKSATATMETKRQLIRGLIGRRTAYPIFMENLLVHLPGSMWLSSLSTQIAIDGSISFSFGAVAYDIHTIADLVRNMETSAVIKSLELGSISESGFGQDLTYTFSVNGVFRK